MGNVTRERVRIKPRVIGDVSTYPDTFEMFTKRKPSRELGAALRSALGRPLTQYRTCIDENGVVWGYVIIANQPNIAALHVLDAWHQQYRCSICRFDAAFDLDTRPGVTREEIDYFLRNNIYLRYRRSTDQDFQFEGTHYAVKRAGRKSRSTKDIASYSTKPSKLTGELDQPHFEVRFQTARAVKAAGIERPIDIIDINPRLLLERYCLISSTKERRDKAIKRTIRETRPTPYIKDVERRAHSLWTRAGYDSLSVFRQMFPKQFERLKPMQVLNVPDQFEYVNNKMGNLSPLLPRQRKRIRLGDRYERLRRDWPLGTGNRRAYQTDP